MTKVKDTLLNKVENRGIVFILAYIIYSPIILNFGAKIMLSDARTMYQSEPMGNLYLILNEVKYALK